jgi:hypothetical protein
MPKPKKQKEDAAVDDTGLELEDDLGLLGNSDADGGISDDDSKASNSKGEDRGKKSNAASKEDPSRYQYWQGKHDRLLERMREIEPVVPLAELVSKRKDIMAAIQEMAARPEGEKKLIRPERPKRPANFDEAVAREDLDSPSAKYLVEAEVYHERLAEYQDERIKRMESDFGQMVDGQKKREQELAAGEKLRRSLAERGIVGGKADKFIEVYTKPGKLTFDNLVDFFNMIDGGGETRKRVPRDEFSRGYDGHGTPPPVAFSAGYREEVEVEKDEIGESFSQDLLAKGKAGVKKISRT